MADYKIGLDFGTHQTKICLEDSNDRRNKRYFFHKFFDDKGCEQYTLPSIVMVKKDRTIAYGYVNVQEALQAYIMPQSEEPVKPKLALWSYPPEPELPELPNIGEKPQPPDLDAVLRKYPKPIKPQLILFSNVPETPPEKHTVFNDLTDLSQLLDKETLAAKRKADEKDAMAEYNRAMNRYNIELKAYNRWLKKARSRAMNEYNQRVLSYHSKAEKYDTILAKRKNIQKAYEAQCEEVDKHNERVREQLPSRMAEYEDALQRWNDEKNHLQPIVMRYFKQAVFSTGLVWRYEWSPMLVSIWYLTYVFFDLDEKYGIENLMLYMGTSSSSRTWQRNKEVATQMMLTVYYMIENVFHHDQQAFLNCTVDDLVKLTSIVPYSIEMKENNSIYVFPEAYANLNPMALGGKFGNGMNLVVDIGGGTTDISLFSSPRGKELLIYDYISIPFGLNAVAEYGVEKHKSSVFGSVYEIVHRIEQHARHIGVPQDEITRVLQKRPIVYTGGGSTRNDLCCRHIGFTDIKLLRDNVGENILIEDRTHVISLMAILSTALGLAMCKDKDDCAIKLQSIKELFDKVEEAYINESNSHGVDRYEHGISDW